MGRGRYLAHLAVQRIDPEFQKVTVSNMLADALIEQASARVGAGELDDALPLLEAAAEALPGQRQLRGCEMRRLNWLQPKPAKRVLHAKRLERPFWAMLRCWPTRGVPVTRRRRRGLRSRWRRAPRHVERNSAMMRSVLPRRCRTRSLR